MKMNVYSVIDRAVSAFLPPFQARTHDEAVRMFRESVSDPKSNFHKYASDYDLYFLATWDDADGSFACGEGPVKLKTGLAVAQEVFQPDKAS